MFDLSFEDPAKWKPLLLKENVTDAIWKYKLAMDGRLVRCEIIDSWASPDIGHNKDGDDDDDAGVDDGEVKKKKDNAHQHVRYYYSTLIYPDYERQPHLHKMINEVPREAFVFEDIRYSSDMFLPNAFRHDIRISDEMFPSSWKNVIINNENDDDEDEDDE